MAFKIDNSLYTNQGGSRTVITDTGEAKGNQSGKKGTVYTQYLGTNYRVSLDLESGTYFDFQPDYSGGGGVTFVQFDFGSVNSYFTNDVPKHFEFYLFWHNYRDTYNSSSLTFNYFLPTSPNLIQQVRFKDGINTTLNNSNSGLLDGFTQVFKFTSIDAPNANFKPYHGSLYMRNCR